MCLAVPAKVIELHGDSALVEIRGNFREVNVSLVENPKIGEYVLIHAGFAIDKVDENVVQEIQEIEGIG